MNTNLKRLLAYGIDHCCLLLASTVLILPMLFSNTLYLWGLALAISILLNKDGFRGKSIGKRYLNIRVIDYKTKEIASTTKCLVRNLTLILWPIEVIVIIFNPSRKLGDYIAGTQIIEDLDKDQRPSKKEIFNIVFIILITSLCLFLPIFIITQNPLAQLLFKI